MARKSRRAQMPKQRNFAAAMVRDPAGPYKPKTIPDKRERPVDRKRKHKGRPLDDHGHGHGY